MIISIHQPSYWPWLGLLDKIAKTDIFILLDNVQVVKGSYQYRNKFFCNGEAKFITLPINLKLGMTFSELKFKNDNWREDHLNKFYNYYLRSPYFDEVFDDLKKIYSKDFDSPLNFLIKTINFSFEKLGIQTKMLLSSNYNVGGKKADLVLNLCKIINCDKYIAGTGSYDYMQVSLQDFEKESIKIEWHSFRHPFYKQQRGAPFIEGLGCLDLFFFQGYKKSREIFWGNI
ncbi:hypothetical protein C4577_00890 [Candidatus Parcubacteria bacterium]|nr:MAG: hypothetical protein C4577_00890 [Candidatus Parcubacteria bacterium]